MQAQLLAAPTSIRGTPHGEDQYLLSINLHCFGHPIFTFIGYFSLLLFLSFFNKQSALEGLSVWCSAAPKRRPFQPSTNRTAASTRGLLQTAAIVGFLLDIIIACRARSCGNLLWRRTKSFWTGRRVNFVDCQQARRSSSEMLLRRRRFDGIMLIQCRPTLERLKSDESWARKNRRRIPKIHNKK